MNTLMDTLVVQSFRRIDVPDWIRRCLASVERWAALRGYDYQFVGDEIFDLVPPPYLARAGHVMLIVVDLARLILARDALAKGYRRVIWCDADVLVFAPDRFELPRERSFYFCREVWLELAGTTIEVSRRVNNCTCAFETGNSFLEFYIDACQQLVRDASGALSPLMASTRFLTALDRILPLPQIQNVGLFAPHVVRDAALGGGIFFDTLERNFGSPIDAANLCASLRGQRFRLPDQPPFVLDDELFNRAVDALEARGRR